MMKLPKRVRRLLQRAIFFLVLHGYEVKREDKGKLWMVKSEHVTAWYRLYDLINYAYNLKRYLQGEEDAFEEVLEG